MLICSGLAGHSSITGKNKDSCVSELGCKFLQMGSGLDQCFKSSNFIFHVWKPFGSVLPRAFVKHFVDFILAVFVC